MRLCVYVQSAWGVGMQLLLDTSLNLPPEALFFAANMIHTKARREWTKVPAATKPQMAASIQSALEDVQTGRRAFHSALFSKLCAIYAVMLVSAPDECNARLTHLAAPATVAQALARNDRAQLLFFLTLARCVCEEIEDAELPFAARDAMEMHLYALSKDVTRAITTVVSAHDDAPSSDVVDLRSEAFQCLNAWSAKAGVSLTTMFLHDRATLFTLIDALCSKSKYLPVCAEILGKVITVAEYPTPSDQESALCAVANGLLKTRAACESALVAEEDEISHAITDVVSTFCETYVEWIVAGSAPEGVALGEMMLALGAHPRRQIASLTLEFWLLVQDEPVAERHAFFQRDAFSQLFTVLLRQCTYAQDPSEMDELELDDLLAFRIGSQGVSDAFLAIFSLESEHVLTHLSVTLAGTCSAFGATADDGDWPSAEASLFALSIVADDVKKRVTSKRSSDSRLDALVAQILESVLRTPAPHVQVVTAATKVLGQFAPWFLAKAVASGSTAVLVTVLQYLDSALGAPPSCANAARSFMQIATVCAECLAQMPPAFLVASIQRFSDAHMTIDDRLFVVEGLVRAATVSPQCSTILEAVVTDALRRLDHVLALERVDEFVLTVVGHELRVLSKVVRFLDAPADVAGGRGMTASVVQHIWPHLEPIAARLSDHEGVMDALFQLYGWCLQSLRDDMASQLGAIATLIVRVFERHQFVAPLECACVAVDVFGKRSGGDELAPQVVESFRDLLTALSLTAFQFFTTHALSDAPDVLRAFYELAYRFALFCPAAVLTSSAFPVLTDLSLACLGNQDRASTNAVIVFLAYVVSESRGKLAPFRDQIDRAVLGASDHAPSPQLTQWIDTIVAALAIKSPSILFDAVGKLFFAVLSTFGDVPTVPNALMLALTTKGDALGVTELALADRERVLELWMRLALAPTRQAERRFRGLCSDVAKICRKELTVDALEVYEWDA